MKKIILLLVILILVLGCIQTQVPSDSNNINKSSNADLNKLFTTPVQEIDFFDINLFNTAKLNKEVTFCELISNSYMKSRCFLEFAKDTNDENLCEKITVSSVLMNCLKYFANPNN